MDAVALSRHYWDVFILAFVAVALWESFRPRVPDTRATLRRWGRNGTLASLAMLVGVALRVSPVLIASAVSNSPWGLLNRPTVPVALRIAAALLVIDFFRYVQHRLLHQIPLLWRAHQVHHADEQFDLTTGLRFHPLEVVVTHVSYIAFVALLAPPVEAAVLALFATMLQNFFSHANAGMPRWCDRQLRRILITPEMHRVHHSVRLEEQNTNFGSVLPFWDRLCGTYLAAPLDGRETLRFGLQELEHAATPTITTLLALPFVRTGAPAGEPAGRSGPPERLEPEPHRRQPARLQFRPGRDVPQ